MRPTSYETQWIDWFKTCRCKKQSLSLNKYVSSVRNLYVITYRLRFQILKLVGINQAGAGPDCYCYCYCYCYRSTLQSDIYSCSQPALPHALETVRPIWSTRDNDQRPRLFVQMSWDAREMLSCKHGMPHFKLPSPSGPSWITKRVARFEQSNAFRKLEQFTESRKVFCQFPIMHNLHLTPCPLLRGGKFHANWKVVPSATQAMSVLHAAHNSLSHNQTAHSTTLLPHSHNSLSHNQTAHNATPHFVTTHLIALPSITN